ncbi:MAG: DNA repair protein RadA [Nitrospinota bacterium]
MKKVKTVFVCQSCGASQPKWAGRCPSCSEWNTLVEEKVKPKSSAKVPSGVGAQPVALDGLDTSEGARLTTGIGEMDRVLGGGIVPGSLVLIGGDPGIGKSTLLLQVSGKVAAKGKVLYVSGEESAQQIKMRADRLSVKTSSLFVLTETNVELIAVHISAERPELVVIDSIQTVYTESLGAAPGSVGQIRESTALLTQTCKSSGIPVFLVGHVTKDGAIAGPRVLEHMVDTVLYFEGDRDHSFRILRSVKNRFGSTHEIGVFEMRESGLEEVKNPSEVFITEGAEESSGSVIAGILSGTRPILVELQSLVTPTTFGNPRRTAVGLDYSRIILLAAILQKRAGLVLDSEDIYVSATGGMRVDDPGSDLALAAAIISSFRNRPVERSTVFIGEVGLGGEVRPVSSLNLRLKEAARMGMKRAVIPSVGSADLPDAGAMELEKLDHVGNLS